jgi:hypothetical protein
MGGFLNETRSNLKHLEKPLFATKSTRCRVKKFQRSKIIDSNALKRLKMNLAKFYSCF